MTNLPETLKSHEAWLRGDPAGVRANLSGANLSRANLSGANLSGANLSGANLSEANLHGANLIRANLREANLREANLSDADLSGANLSGANLIGANLIGADLSESRGLRYAYVSFSGHGERGRQLTAAHVAGEVRLFCGCFSGTEADLRAYIAEGDPVYASTRTLALETVLRLIAEGA